MVQKNAKWWNNGVINKRSIDCPGNGFIPGRKTFQRMSPTGETRKKISEANKGTSPWNKGLKTGPESAETRKKKSVSAKGNTNAVGSTPWNKGLTSDDPRIASYSSKQRGQSRNGNYVSGADHPNWNEDTPEYQRFRKQVDVLTEKVYTEYKQEINPNDYPRTLAGVENGYQLDHIIPVHYGWVVGMTADELSQKENLQMLPWKDNLKKSNNL